jgi:hypothetical protein
MRRVAGEVDAVACEEIAARQSIAGMVVREKNRCVQISGSQRYAAPFQRGF